MAVRWFVTLLFGGVFIKISVTLAKLLLVSWFCKSCSEH